MWAVNTARRRRELVIRAVAVAAVLGIALSTCAPASAQRVLGLDISAWQENISQATWNSFRNVANRQFVFLRSSRGGTTGYYNQNDRLNANRRNKLSQRYDDPYFVQNINRAAAAGMFAGPYHFSRPDIVAGTLNANGIPNNGADEADHFLQMAGAWMRPGYLLPVHDFEDGDGDRSDDDMAQFCMDFSNRIYEVMGIRPAIYVNGNYAHNILGGAASALRSQVVAGYPTFWSARWPNQDNPSAIDVQNSHPKDSFTNIYGPWDDSGTTHPWAFWQYTSKGRLQSFYNGGRDLDFDVAQGDIEFLKDRLVPAVWMNDNSGDWSTLANWNSGQTPVAPVAGVGQVPPVGALTLPTPRLPGAQGTGVTAGRNDTVILDRPSANITVTLSSGVHDIRKLFVREALNITGGSLNINYDPAYPSDTVNYSKAQRSGLSSAQFSAPVSISSDARLSVHTLQVDASQMFTLDGGTLAFNTIRLMPHSTTPAQIDVTDDVTITSLNNATATIVSGGGTGSGGVIDLRGDARTFHVADGAAAVDMAVNVPIINGALTKAGAGTLALNAANSYEGATVVQAGVLSIASPFLADAADVFLNSGATLDLSFTGAPDTLESLFIDGISQAAGVWGPIGSDAQFTSSLLTGTGMLKVTTFGTPLVGDYNGDGVVAAGDYEVWRATFGQGIVAGSGADSNRDGLIDAGDYVVWRRQMTAAAASATSPSPVPEPMSASLLLMALGVAYFLVRSEYAA